jgi:hypothetical protein
LNYYLKKVRSVLKYWAEIHPAPFDSYYLRAEFIMQILRPMSFLFGESIPWSFKGKKAETHF